MDKAICGSQADAGYPPTDDADCDSDLDPDPCMLLSMHEQDMAIVKGLVPVAWADGTFAAREKEMLDALLEAYNATDQEKRALLDYAAQRRTIDDIDLQELSSDDRRMLLQHAVLLTFADGEQSPEEATFLAALAKKLRIPDDEARALTDAATARARRSMKADSAVT